MNRQLVICRFRGEHFWTVFWWHGNFFVRGQLMFMMFTWRCRGFTPYKTIDLRWLSRNLLHPHGWFPFWCVWRLEDVGRYHYIVTNSATELCLVMLSHVFFQPIVARSIWTFTRQFLNVSFTYSLSPRFSSFPWWRRWFWWTCGYFHWYILHLLSWLFKWYI